MIYHQVKRSHFKQKSFYAQFLHKYFSIWYALVETLLQSEAYSSHKCFSLVSILVGVVFSAHADLLKTDDLPQKSESLEEQL